MRALRALGGAGQTLADLEAAERRYRASRDLFVELRDEKGIAILDYRLGLIATECGDTVGAARLLEHSLSRFRVIGQHGKSLPLQRAIEEALSHAAGQALS